MIVAMARWVPEPVLTGAFGNVALEFGPSDS
jgi:hypothetical protein